jgi:hypothetical protein
MEIDDELDKLYSKTLDAIKKTGVRKSARKIGCSAGYISRITKKKPGLKSMLKIARSLGVE